MTRRFHSCFRAAVGNFLLPVCPLILLQAACGPAVRLKAPEQWPTTWCGRQLHHTPSAYIYATSGAAAGEADRLIMCVRKEFENATGAKPTKGMILVTDERDALLPLKWDLLVKLDRHASTQPSDGDPIAEAADEIGVDRGVFYRMIAFHMTREQAGLLMDLPEPLRNAPGWVAVVPTRATLAGVMRRMMKAAYKKNDIGVVAQAMVAPIMASVEPKMIDMLATTRDVALFAALVEDQAQWTDDEKHEKQRVYGEQKTKRASDEFTTSISIAQTRPAGLTDTRPAETRPALASQPASAPAETQPAAASQPSTAPAETPSAR